MMVCKAASMNAYSLDLRLKVLDAIDRGIPRKEVVRTFASDTSRCPPSRGI